MNTQINMAVNLGTRGVSDALNLLEYCNSDKDTYYADLRRKNGFYEPFRIKTWCLGNEMDSPWQIGQKTSQEYGRIAGETAKLMKSADPDIEIVVCGSSSYNTPTFGQWEYEVLDHTYDSIDYISLHQYYSNFDSNSSDFLGRSVHMDSFIKSVAAICDAVKAKKHSSKTINLAFDEWNVWRYETAVQNGNGQVAPPLLEEIYSFEDSLLVGCMLITLQNNCDRIKIACLAQLVNVIAPIMTETDGKIWAQTIFYPYLYASQNGRGTVLKTVNKCDSYKTSDGFEVPYIETSVIVNEDRREIVVFAVNRSLDENLTLELSFEDFNAVKKTEHIELYSDDLKAINTKDNEFVAPNKVAFESKEALKHTEELKKHSWNMFKYSY